MIADNDRFKPIFSNRRIGAAKEINTTANKKEQQKFETRILIVNAPFFMAANRFRRKNMKTLLKQVCSLILVLLMVLSVVSVPTFSAKAEDGENPPSAMTLNEALNVEGGTIEFTNSGDYIDSENGNYIWRVEDDHIASPEIGRYEKKAIITAEVTANEGDIVSFDFICTVWDAIYVRGGLLFSIDNKELESGYGYGYVGCYDWTHKEYALTAGKHTLKWVFQLSTNATSGRAKLDNVYVGEPVHPSEIVLQDTAEVGVNCRTQLACEVLPAEAFNKSVAFSSSDENVAAVLDDGTVVGISAGRAVITASTVDGGHTDTCEVNVIDTGKISSELFIYNETYVYDKRFYHTSLHKFTSSLPEFTELVADLSDDELNGYTITACEYVGGKIYGYMTTNYYNYRYIIIDAESQTVDYWGRTNLLNPQAIRYDYTTNTLYAIAYPETSSAKKALYTVDIDTGELTKIAGFSNSNLTEMVISRDGRMFGFIYSTVYEINKATGELTRLFAFDAPDGYTKWPWNAVCDFDTGLIYVLYESRTNSKWNINQNLYEINIDEMTAESCGYITLLRPGSMFMKKGIELPEREKTKFTVTFVDSIDGAVIGTKQYEVGTTLDEATFPAPPEHDGYAFTCWEYDENYDGEYLLYDVTATAYYHEAEAPATIIVNNNYDSIGPYYYWTTRGCQMLIDADANTYGNIIPEQRVWLQTVISDPETFYDNFEYRLPEGASAEFSPYSSMYHKKQLINIPAGTYDWCFIAPTANGNDIKYYFMSDDGNIAACFNDYRFEAGYTYEFNVTHILAGSSERNTHVDLTVTRGNTEPVYAERVEIDLEHIVVYSGYGAEFKVTVYPEDAFDKQVLFTSSDPSVGGCTVDVNQTNPSATDFQNFSSDACLSGRSPGNITITATPMDSHAEGTTMNVTVREDIPDVSFVGYLQHCSEHAFKDYGTAQAWFRFNTGQSMISVHKQVSEDRYDEYWNFPYNVAAAAYAGGKVYGYQNRLWYGKTRADFFVIDYNKDPNNLEEVLTGVNAGLEVVDMAYNHANDTMYAIAYNEEYGDALSLYTVDIALGTLTEVAPLYGADEEGFDLKVICFAIDENGKAYGLNEISSLACKKDYLLGINLNTGEVTVEKEIFEINSGTSYTTYRSAYGTSIVYDYENDLIRVSYYMESPAIIFPETGEIIYRGWGSGISLSTFFIPDDIPVPEPVMPSFTVTFIDGFDNSVIETRTIEGGCVLDEAIFPETAEHDGVVFRGWEYFGKVLSSDITIRALYSSPEYLTSIITLNVIDEGFRYGTTEYAVSNGYQMLLDAEANTSNESIMFAHGWNTPINDAGRQYMDEYYSDYEYSIPRNASGSEKDAETVLNETKSVRIPAGTYDWLILYDAGQCNRPFADSFGNIGGRFDDFEFLPGFVYEFKVYWMGRCHAIDLEITPIVPDENPDAGVCVLLGEIAGSPGEEIETEVVIEGDYEANSFDMALEYDASDIEVLEITPGQVIQEIVENGGEFDLQQGSGTGSGGSGSSDASTGTIDAKAESGGMAFGGNGQIMKMKVKIPEDAEAGEKNMDMTVNDLSKNNSDGTTEQVPHYDVTGNSATGSIGGGGSGGSGGGSGGVVTDPTTPIPTGEPTPTGEPVPTPTPNPNASFFVTFVDWDGRTIAIKTAKYGEAATPPPDPERENFIFVGWEGDFSCVTANTAVLAKYGPIPNSGDASGDGAVNAVDALVAMRYVLGVSTENLTPEQIAAADFNGDSAVNAVDTLLIMRFSLGLIEAVVKEPVQDA